MGRNNSLRTESSSGIQAISSHFWYQQRAPSTVADWLTMRFDEIAPIKPLSPEQARLKSMKDRVKRDQEAVKAERARQKIKAGQSLLKKVSNNQSV